MIDDAGSAAMSSSPFVQHACEYLHVNCTSRLLLNRLDDTSADFGNVGQVLIVMVVSFLSLKVTTTIPDTYSLRGTGIHLLCHSEHESEMRHIWVPHERKKRWTKPIDQCYNSLTTQAIVDI